MGIRINDTPKLNIVTGNELIPVIDVNDTTNSPDGTGKHIFTSQLLGGTNSVPNLQLVMDEGSSSTNNTDVNVIRDYSKTTTLNDFINGQTTIDTHLAFVDGTASYLKDRVISSGSTNDYVDLGLVDFSGTPYGWLNATDGTKFGYLDVFPSGARLNYYLDNDTSGEVGAFNFGSKIASKSINANSQIWALPNGDVFMYSFNNTTKKTISFGVDFSAKAFILTGTDTTSNGMNYSPVIRDAMLSNLDWDSATNDGAVAPWVKTKEYINNTVGPWVDGVKGASINGTFRFRLEENGNSVRMDVSIDKGGLDIGTGSVGTVPVQFIPPHIIPVQLSNKIGEGSEFSLGRITSNDFIIVTDGITKNLHTSVTWNL